MGFLDEASSLLNRGVANAGRSTRSLAIKAQLSDLKKQRENLCAQLGAALFEQTRNDATFRGVCESVYASIEAIDVQNATLCGELAALEQQARLAQATSERRCPKCATPLGPNDLFCVGCGARIEKQEPIASPAVAESFCASCGAHLAPDARFCANCGSPIAEATTPEPASEVEPDPASVFELEFEHMSEQESEQGPESKPESEPASVSLSAQESELKPTFEPESALDLELEPAPVAAPVEQQSGLCMSCGYKNDDDAIFCRSCGSKL